MSPNKRKQTDEQECGNVTFILDGINEWEHVTLQKRFFHRHIFHDITHLSLESNNIIAIESDLTSHLPNLKWLSLSNNYIANVCWGLLNELSSAPLLRELDVSQQRIQIDQSNKKNDSQDYISDIDSLSGRPLPLGCFKHIKRLISSHNGIVELVWDPLSDADRPKYEDKVDSKEIIYIDVSNNNISHIGLDAIAHFNPKLPLLQPPPFLNLSHNVILIRVLTILCHSLRDLYMACLWILVIIPLRQIVN
ncbi:unnamed protein product [Owenia fusiformis]|uniref:Uncharacterized protein n=1 Tax=Owenia fusiformis TaxID=6347 RepID=A0A8S4MWN8_OWEFU|nr:unnamed protein product [Owenia fusiformis]